MPFDSFYFCWSYNTFPITRFPHCFVGRFILRIIWTQNVSKGIHVSSMQNNTKKIFIYMIGSDRENYMIHSIFSVPLWAAFLRLFRSYRHLKTSLLSIYRLTAMSVIYCKKFYDSGSHGLD